jgi:hypothetical protein
LEAAEDRRRHIEQTSTSDPQSLAYFLEFAPGQFDQSGSILPWERAIHNQLSKALGAESDKQLPAREWPGHYQERDLARLLAKQRRFVERRIGDLERVRTRLPSGAPLTPPATADFADVRASGLIEEVQLNAYLKRMSSNKTPQQISASIGAAKEVVEAVLKGALDILDPSAVYEHDLLKLAKQVRKQLDARLIAANMALPGAATTQLMSGLSSIESALAALRNQVGLGHGRTSLPKSLRTTHALLAIDVSQAHSRYVIRTLVDLRLVTLM